jgi:hypothetical protein
MRTDNESYNLRGKPCLTCHQGLVRGSQDKECDACQKKTALIPVSCPECGNPQETNKSNKCFRCHRRLAYELLHKIDCWASAHPQEMKAHAKLVNTEKGLAFPEDCMYGRLGELALDMQMPLGYAYPALLAAYSYVPMADRMCGCRINLNAVIIAPVGVGKIPPLCEPLRPSV